MLKRFSQYFGRRVQRGRRQLDNVLDESNQGFERDVLKRLPKLAKVWRPLTAWIGLLLLLIGCLIAQILSLGNYYQDLKPIPGGIYTEGIVGSFTNANPIYATNEVDRTVSKLLFPGLFTYDQSNRLIGDLANGWKVDDTGKIYTVSLRDGLRWQDGTALTADDVVFTYQVIQNSDAESPLRSSWEGIKVSAVNDRTVTFTLPNPLASFIGGVTNGIVPKHLLEDVPMVGMRSSGFNTRTPVGSGPFAWKSIDVKGTNPSNAQETIGLIGSESYYRGAPKLKSFVVRAFADPADLKEAFAKRQLTAMSGLEDTDGLKKDSYIASELPLAAATMAFFRTSEGVLADVAVRKALVAAADPSAVIESLGTGGRPVREPLLAGQLGYDPKYAQHTNDVDAAKVTLDGAGWVAGPDGVRVKDGKKLRFALSYTDQPEFQKVAEILKRQWRTAGAVVDLQPLDALSFRSTLSEHAYEAVLYGITIGSDPDVFVYWHSSQADVRSSNRLNLSEYKSAIVDESLESGRTRNDPALRVIKYSNFLQQWQQDAPALGLYQPQYLYISTTRVYGLRDGTLNTPTDRLDNVNDWMIRTARVTNN
jgi:peptide/nickel transport system substrate-binding protein